MSPGNQSTSNPIVDETQRPRNEQSLAAAPSLISNLVTLPPRRTPVTSACKNCRKSRVKCSGARPTCMRCAKANVACEYTAPPGLTTLQAEREKNNNYENVIDLLRKGDLDDAVQALQRLRTEVASENAVTSISDAQLLLAASASASAPPSKTLRTNRSDGIDGSDRRRPPSWQDGDLSKYMTDARDMYVDHNVFIDLSARNLPLSRWTSASKDDKLMNHLLNLFFNWDNVVERAIYRPIFDEDVVSGRPDLIDPRPGTFCSPFLINALLAAGSLYTLDPATFKEVDVSSSRGRAWADEAVSLLEKNPTPSLPLLQGLYCLFVYEGDVGSGERSVYYFHRAMQTYRALNEHPYKPSDKRKNAARLEQERHATSWCMWGFYCCEWRASQALGLRKQTSIPKIERTWHESTFKLSQPECPSYWWMPYPDPTKIQRSMRIEIRDEDIRLAQIVEKALDFIYPLPGGKPPVEDPDRMLRLYDALIEWRQTCQPRIRFEEAVLPAAILLHIGLEVMLTAILRPFAHLTVQQLIRFDPRERCYQHASGIMTAVWTYRAFAILRYEYWLTYVASHAAYIVLREAADVPMHMDTIIRACQCLKELSISYPIANDSLLGILGAFKRCKLPVPGYLIKYFDSCRPRNEGIMDWTVAALLLDAEMVTEGEMHRSELQLRELLTEVPDRDEL